MKLSNHQWRALLLRCIYYFFLDGTLKAYGVILEQVVETLTTPYCLVGFVFTLQTGIGYLISPLASVLLDKFGGHFVGIVGSVLVAGGHLCLAISYTLSTWGLFASIILSGSGFGLLNVVTVLPLKEQFRDSYRHAFSVTLLASSLGVAVLPLLLDKLLRTFRKVEAMVIFSTLSWTLASIGIFIPVVEVSEYGELPQDTNSDEEVIQSEQTLLKEIQETSNDRCYHKDGERCNKIESELQIEETAKPNHDEKGFLSRILSLVHHHLDILYLVCIYGIYIANYCSWSIFLVPYGEFLGFTPKRAVLLSTIGGVAAFLGRLFSARLSYCQNLNVKLSIGISCLMVAISYSLSFIVDTFPVLAMVAFFSGFGLAVQGNLCCSNLPMWVCDNHFKAAVVLLYTAGGFMAEFGGIVSGGVIDLTGSHRSAFVLATAFCVLQFFLAVIWSMTSCETRNGPD